MSGASSSLRVIGAALVAAAVVASPAEARRLPGPGGKATVALPPELVGPTIEAHLYAPIVEPAIVDDAAAALARPPLPGFPAWRSSVLTGLSPQERGRTWVLTSEGAATLVAESIARCLAANDTRSWPAAVLSARGVGVDVAASGSEVKLRFSEPVGPVPELLAGCQLRTSSSQPTGGYSLVSPGVLAWKSGSFGPPPLLGVVEITSAPSPRADLLAGGSESPGAATLLAPFPDVVILVQPRGKVEDPLGLFDDKLGSRGFRQAFRADLLAAAYAQGRGAPAHGLLPPGIAPARPLPEPQGPERLAPLSLTQLPADAPRFIVRRVEGDQLLDGVVERLAVIARNRGRLLEVKRADGGAKDGVELLRWRPPSSDPALALLSLAGSRRELVENEAAKRALSDARLLSGVKEERVAAAVVLERAWLDAGLAVPLMTADRWFTADPDLRGVTIREDGVPLLFDATFGGFR